MDASAAFLSASHGLYDTNSQSNKNTPNNIIFPKYFYLRLHLKTNDHDQPPGKQTFHEWGCFLEVNEQLKRNIERFPEDFMFPTVSWRMDEPEEAVSKGKNEYFSS